MLYKADIHIHTVLSPCGDLYMSPSNIVEAALKKSLNIIGITDHNSTLNVEVTNKIAKKYNILVLYGAEVTTREEVHCLCFMPSLIRLSEFQKYIDNNIRKIPNDIKRLGYQLVVDENEQILDEIPHSLLAATNLSINQLRNDVADFDGIFIPAHINRSANSIDSQLGFMPDDLNPDAIELYKYSDTQEFLKKNQQLANLKIFQSSDAHFINDIASAYTNIEIEELSFEAFKKALCDKK